MRPCYRTSWLSYIVAVLDVVAEPMLSTRGHNRDLSAELSSFKEIGAGGVVLDLSVAGRYSRVDIRFGVLKALDFCCAGPWDPTALVTGGGHETCCHRWSNVHGCMVPLVEKCAKGRLV